MEPDSKNGKTAWDFLAEICKSNARLWGLVIVALFVVAVLGLISMSVHIVAKPGADVELLWGFAKYQKNAENPTVQERNVPALTNNYYYPKNERVFGYVSENKKGPKTIPILDKTLNISVLEEQKGIVFRGSNVSDLSIGARDEKGNPLKINKTNDDKGIWVYFDKPDVTIEIKYMGNFFTVVIIGSDESPLELTVQQIPNSSLKLTTFQKL